MDLEAQLFEDYVFYWRRTMMVQRVQQRIGRATRSLQPTRERLAALRKMAMWCVAQHIDPRLWLYTLFVARCWTYAPKWTALTPKTHLARYRKEQRVGLFKQRLAHERQSRRRAQGDEFDPNVDISSHVEALKGELVRTGRMDDCIDRMSAETFGYHPKSAVCRRCSAQTACLATLQKSVAFDIVALRRGDITAEQAQAAVQAHYEACLTPQDLIYGTRI